jgi:hypothetical protein
MARHDEADSLLAILRTGLKSLSAYPTTRPKCPTELSHKDAEHTPLDLDCRPSIPLTMNIFTGTLSLSFRNWHQPSARPSRFSDTYYMSSLSYRATTWRHSCTSPVLSVLQQPDTQKRSFLACLFKTRRHNSWLLIFQNNVKTSLKRNNHLEHFIFTQKANIKQSEKQQRKRTVETCNHWRPADTTQQLPPSDNPCYRTASSYHPIMYIKMASFPRQTHFGTSPCNIPITSTQYVATQSEHSHSKSSIFKCIKV